MRNANVPFSCFSYVTSAYCAAMNAPNISFFACLCSLFSVPLFISYAQTVWMCFSLSGPGPRTEIVTLIEPLKNAIENNPELHVESVPLPK